jgi:hypothetical protein
VLALPVQDGAQLVRVRNVVRMVSLSPLLLELLVAALRPLAALISTCTAHVLSLALHLLAGHAISQLLLVVFKDFLAHMPLLRRFAHHAFQDLLAAERANEQLEGHIRVLLDLELTARQFLKEVINGTSLVVRHFRVFGSSRSALNDG